MILLADVPCPRCSREVKIIRQRFGADPLVVLNAVPDHVAGDWFISPRSVQHLDEAEARSLRSASHSLYTEHDCGGVAA